MTILSVETSTQVCSAALLTDGTVADERISYNGGNHAELLPEYVDSLLRLCGKIDAVALSAGPGSYTGLRIGTSLCKGLAYGRNIPMVAVPTLDILTEALLEKTQEYAGSLLCPMLDARRMEVYTALYESDGRQIRNVEAKVIDGESFADIAPDKQMVFFGNGAMKCEGVIRRKNSKFVPDIVPLARAMWRLSTERLQRGETVDIAYFEPFYLKDFVAAPSHVKGLK